MDGPEKKKTGRGDLVLMCKAVGLAGGPVIADMYISFFCFVWVSAEPSSMW